MPICTSWAFPARRVRPVCAAACCKGPGFPRAFPKRCTLYPGLPGGGSFTCLVAVGQKQAMAAEACLEAACSYVQDAYRAAPLLNGARWLMLDVKNRQVLRDVQALLRIRAGAR